MTDKLNTAGNVQFPDEVLHLAGINEKLQNALNEAADNVGQIDREYMDMKRYMAQNRGEIDPHEMFQNELSLKQIDRSGAFAAGVHEKLLKMKDSPYFARIDFKAEGKDEAAKYYIGRFTFLYESRPLIFDWRAPVSGLFYDCEPGPAEYDAPSGRIAGELTRKRQFKIQKGKLEYALESAVNIQDDILQRELSRTSNEKMKSIISTIQKEQNRIIRNEKTEVLLIQGAAGSGKTSIALHRIAFLLYRFKDKLSARNVAILSPNRVFGDYISNVLPELGEEPIYELGFQDIAEIQLERVIGFEPDKDPLETGDDKWAERMRFKSTLDFLRQVDKYLGQLPNKVFVPSDCCIEGFSAKSGWIQERFDAYHRHPVKRRLKMIAADIHDKFQSDNIMGDEVPKQGAILKSLEAMLQVKSTLALYRDFYQTIKKPHMLQMPSKNTLEWADVYPFLYFHAAFEGLKESRGIRHLLIDEMQDYTPVQFAVINLLFPCQKTILGDFSQALNPNLHHTLHDIRQVYRKAEFIELNRSYRSTYEIITFAQEVGGERGILPMERHGAVPEIISCGTEREQIDRIKSIIRAFEKSENASLGILLKTNAMVREFYNEFSKELDIRLISPQSTAFENGVSITSIQMSKGLEFDEVVIPCSDCETYHTQHDRRLLYVACTRAMHRLTLIYMGEASPLLPPNA